LIKCDDILTYPLDGIYCVDCVKGMNSLPNESIDLVVTSPPYDGTRDYHGFTYDLHAAGEQIFRVLKDGGVAAVVIQDQTQDFGKTLTSFRTIVDWCDNIGFKLFECVIYRKNGTEGAWWSQRFRVDHEYMPIFVKGRKPQYFNKEPLKIPSKHGGKTMTGSGNRRTDGQTTETVRREINLMKCRGTVWDYLMAGDKSPIKRKHPAPFPDKIPYDFIQCFCPPNGTVLDPFVGSGSTAVGAKKLGRHYLGFDISAEYCSIAERRILDTQVDSPLFVESVSQNKEKAGGTTVTGDFQMQLGVASGSPPDQLNSESSKGDGRVPPR
jgi:site-specific DNA-methyltransferase (adenine-specific)